VEKGVPRLIAFDRIGQEPVGGKAAQLARLAALGLRVPKGFVIVGAAPGQLPPDLDECSEHLGGPVAVRSSAVEEDGSERSFAGQFETILGVQGAHAIRDAVERCLASTVSGRVAAYRDGMHARGESRMSVVVQRMVDAAAAGVIFTADPLNGERERVVIHAVPGLGESLVGGYRTPDRFVLSRAGELIERSVEGDDSTVDETRLKAMLEDALAAESSLGHPLDLEWALDRDGTVYWLQARPITTLDLPGLDELDSPVAPDWQLTTYNVAEWMPGAMPPLSWSVVGASYVQAMNDLFIRAGLPRSVVERVPILVNVQGHTFINMTNFYVLGAEMFGMDKDSSDLTLTGQVLPPATLPPNAPLLQRLQHTIGYFRLMPKARMRLEDFVARHGTSSVDPVDDPVEYFSRLERMRLVFFESGAVHVHTSMMAIALLGLFQRLLNRGGAPGARSHAAVAALLAGAKSVAERSAESSIGVADALDRLGESILAQVDAGSRFVESSAEAGLQWLRDPASGEAGRAFEAFLAAHGHRCIRELDFRERDWEEDPLSLVKSLQRIVSAPPAPKPDWSREAEMALAPLNPFARALIRRLLPTARRAVVQRERSKSLSVRLARQLKRGYVGFARQLVRLGRLPDADLVFFFEHAELARLAHGEDRELVRRAEHRRRLHPRKLDLEFPRVCKGKPVPVAPGEFASGNGDPMQGTPLSRGLAVGRARVARTLAEAARMQPGEILVTPFTDVGWTPYFSRAAGLATEVGSVLSHGAVIAREYGLPAVAGLPGITRRVRTGELLQLDGNTGEVRRLGPGRDTSGGPEPR
jgi:rifampicin phosphotransferase